MVGKLIYRENLEIGFPLGTSKAKGAQRDVKFEFTAEFDVNRSIAGADNSYDPGNENPSVVFHVLVLDKSRTCCSTSLHTRG